MNLNRREWLRWGGGALGCGLLSQFGRAAAQGQSGAVRSAPIRIGQIGVGHAHATKLSVYRNSPDYEVVGLVESDPVLRQKAESQPAFHGVPWMTQAQLLATPGLQAVLVETRVRDLLPTAHACVAAGKHIHMDKPAGASFLQFERLIQAANRKRLLVQMGYMYRYNPGVVLLREFLRQGWLGDIFEVHAVMSKVVEPAARREFAEFSGGILFELGGHIIDLVVHVLGKPDRVMGYPRRSTDPGDGLMDNMLAVFEYPRATASVKCSALEVEGFDRRHLVVCGTRGTFQIQPLDNPSARISLDQPRGVYRKGTQDIAFSKYTRYIGDAVDMARIIRGEKTADFSPSHDLAVQSTLLKACGMSLRS